MAEMDGVRRDDNSDMSGKYRSRSSAKDGQKIIMDFPKDNDTPGSSYQVHDEKMAGGPTNLAHSLSGVRARMDGEGAAKGKRTEKL